MKTLLVTGATGFVGRNLLIREITRGTQILAPVRSAEKLRSQLILEGLDPRAVRSLDPEPENWPTGIHPTHALLSAGVLFARNREEYFATNVDWTLRILEALPESTRIVVLSSQSAGGPTPAGRRARTESDADTPLTWYGKSKLALERALHAKSSRRLCILRPPMILGPRDTATLPLFKMATGLIRTKPGLRRKEFSFLSVEDVVEAIEAAWTCDASGPLYISAHRTITDWELIDTAARTARGKGVTLPIPITVVKAMSLLVDSIPALRRSAPSLTRDRAKEIWADRWVVDSSAFRKATGWKNRHDLAETLREAFGHYVREGHFASPTAPDGAS
ncbi:MAG: NAD-dependent epimerase/dehydratase family protein [Terrimicrobiaceae bacterium]